KAAQERGKQARSLVEQAKEVRDALTGLAKHLPVCALVQGGGKCFVLGVTHQSGRGNEDRALNDAQPGQRANTLGSSKREEGVATPALVINRPEWRLVRMALRPGERNEVRVALLRRLEWLTAQKVEEGATVWLDMPEMDAQGQALVVGVEPCPDIEEGPGRVITGTFAHKEGWAHDLLVEGSEESIGVTAQHPFWSPDRNIWVPAGELREGERLLAADGSTPRVISFTPRPGPEPVYNIEVEGDHCYRVGEQGLLVHNQSAVWTGPTNKECTERIGHCPQLDGSTGFSSKPKFNTETSTT